MNGYSIYTLWGEPTWGGESEPVQVAVAVDFFERREWRVVVERQASNGVVVQRDVTGGLTIGEAMDAKENLVRVYRADGFLTDDNLTFYAIGQGETTIIFLDAESSGEIEKSHANAEVSHG